jgi:hypothetical protein
MQFQPAGKFSNAPQRRPSPVCQPLLVNSQLRHTYAEELSEFDRSTQTSLVTPATIVEPKRKQNKCTYFTLWQIEHFTTSPRSFQVQGLPSHRARPVA